jgi:molecular chaperone GrpE (heat shock protein)
MLAPRALADGYKRMIYPPPDGPFGGAQMSQTPLVGDLNITLGYPLYTQRPTLTLPSSSGDFRAMAGSTIEIETIALGEVEEARLVFDPESGEDEEDAREPISMSVGPDGRTLSVRFEVRAPTAYRFLLIGSNGKRRVEASPHTIELQLDEAPTVELYAPADELDVASLKRVELAYILEDDFGLDKVELVWEHEGEEHRRPITADTERRSAQGKFLWDLAEVDLKPGVRVPYHLECTDNDNVLGPNIGKSKVYYLRVFSPRERHQMNVERQKELFEKLIRSLGGRLVVEPEDLRAHTVLQRDDDAIVVELGTLVAAMGDDELAAKDLRTTLEDMRTRLDKLTKAEAKLLAKMEEQLTASANTTNITYRIRTSDEKLVTELETDVLLLADWIDRQQMENLLAISDEIKTHQQRLRELLDEYARTGSEEIKAEIEREMRALEAKLAELQAERAGLAEDVLDRFVNTDALAGDQTDSCMAEVQKLIESDDLVAAQKKMEECMNALDMAAMAMEQSLRDLRGDKFSEEEKKFGELMDQLADLAQDEKDIAKEADNIWERYAQRADDMMKDKAKETRKKLSKTIDALRKRLDKIPDSGLTPFSKEELEIVESRLDDLEQMLADGDIAEALAMAKQAMTGLQTIEAELEAALMDENDAPWSKKTKEALKGIDKAKPLAKKLVDELEKATPSPDEIMTRKDRKRLDKLRKQQKAVQDRADKLADKAEKMSDELPGNSGEQISGDVREAGEQMGRAQDRMKSRDPSGARQEARGAADKLEAAKQEAQGAARNRMQSGRRGMRDEPIRIPGADEYKTPEKFREDILDAMKKEKAPDGFDDQVRRYYEELIR